MRYFTAYHLGSFVNWPVINQSLWVRCFNEHTYIVLVNLHVMTDVPSVDFYFLYNKILIQYFISRDREVLLDYCSMTISESVFHSLILVFPGTFIKKLSWYVYILILNDFRQNIYCLCFLWIDLKLKCSFIFDSVY